MPIIILTDTSLLINFLHIDRLNLLAGHSHEFLITDHVREEVTDYHEHQRERLLKSIADGIIRECSLTTSEELKMFGELMNLGRLGTGECSAIACAATNNYKLAIDDKRAITQAKKKAPGLEILNTQELVVSMIREGLLSVSEADYYKDVWANDCKFTLKVTSFSELI